MNWSEPRKGLKSDNQANQRVSTTCLNTPPRSRANQEDFHCSDPNKQCPYHFSSPSHICLTCRRSICLRCAITYCQQHAIHPQEEIMPLLLVDLEKLTIEPRIENIELRLKQSQEKQEFVSKKVSRMLAQIDEHFDRVKALLDRKKEQIIQYYHEQLANKYLAQYKNQDDELGDVLTWLKQVQENSANCSSIEELDELAKVVKKNSEKFSLSETNNLNSSQRINSNTRADKGNFLFGKDKIKFNKLWSEEKLEKVMFEIENIAYKLNPSNSLDKLPSNKKKRVTTEVSEHPKVSSFFSGVKNTVGMVKSGSNSRFNTGRKIQ